MHDHQKILKKIIDTDLCVGCGLCEGVSSGQVKMIFNEEGFLRPDRVIDDDELNEKIVNACPGHILKLKPSIVPTDPIWGPLVQCRAGHAADDKTRHVASSGGGLSAVLRHLLTSGFADNVIQITADTENPIYNELRVNNTQSDIVLAAGSRYCPSAPLAALPELLIEGQRSILVGKPCDIAGARQFLDQNPDYQSRLVLLVSFMCGGMSSIKGTHEILRQLAVQETDLKSFRYRGEGWPGTVKAELKDGSSTTMSYDHSWGNILRNYTQFRCKICPDAVGQFADIVFADAWYINENNHPSFDESKGRSMILTRTLLGEEICTSAIKSGELCVEPLEVEMMNKMQPYHVKRKQLSLSRMIALRMMGRNVPTTRNLLLKRAAFNAGIWANIRSFIGALRRILLREL